MNLFVTLQGCNLSVTEVVRQEKARRDESSVKDQYVYETVKAKDVAKGLFDRPVIRICLFSFCMVKDVEKNNPFEALMVTENWIRQWPYSWGQADSDEMLTIHGSRDDV